MTTEGAVVGSVAPATIPIRAERKGRGWTLVTMARKLRDAADDPRDIPSIEAVVHNIQRWEKGRGGVSERYRHLYCRVFGLSEWELFGIDPPDIIRDDDGEGEGMPYARTSLRAEKRKLREEMRAAGLDFRQIATEFSRVYKLRPRAAWREAYGWSLQEAADNINAFRGDTGLDPGGLSGMTSAHLCEYEKWPGYRDIPAGRKPSAYLLAVLAGIYGCQVSDLVDLADRQHLSKADLLIIDTYAPRPVPAPETAGGKPEFLGSPPITDGVMASEDTNGNYYVVLFLPRRPQRIAIDITSADVGDSDAAEQPVRRLTVVGE